MSFKIESLSVGVAEDPVFIIAEISSNHCHDYRRAIALVKAAAAAGADAVKFQTFACDDIAVRDLLIPVQNLRQHYSLPRYFHEIFEKGGLPRDWHHQLKRRAEELGLVFLSTPFSVDAARFLVEEVGVPALKIASGDLTFMPLLEYAASTSLPLIVSTGGATMAEIWAATQDGPLFPAVVQERLALLHCVSSYPCALVDANLKAIKTLRDTFPSMPVGWSDHTLSVEAVPVIAVVMGATIIEKHLTLPYGMPTMDTPVSLLPDDFAAMVRAIRAVPQILGSGAKLPQASELHDKLWARRDPSDYLRPMAEARKGRWE